MRALRSAVAVIGALVLVIAAAATVALTPGRIAAGVRVADIDVGGRSPAEARALLAVAQSSFSLAPVLVIDEGRVWPTTNGELGLVLDVDGATEVALSVGRSGPPADRVREVALAAGGRVDLGWPRRATDERLDAFVERVAGDVDRAPVDGDVRIESDGVRISSALAGRRVDRALLRADILASRDEVAVVALSPDPLLPSIDEEDVARLATRVTAALTPFHVTAGSESLVVEPIRIADVLRVVRDADGLELAVDDVAVEQLVAEIATALDGEARDAVLVPGDEHLVVTAGRDRVAVDRARAATALAAGIIAGEGRIELPADVAAPSFSTASATRIASELRLAGGFTTYFPVNEARRINISRAAATFDGIVIGPGERFSFWERIGEVSPRTGYAYAGAIIGGVSSVAIGGGLCQVSTTLFNAVAAAGYAIDERHPHAYYIERYPMGLDAAVFAPDTDLVWTNDTGVPAIIRAGATDTSVSFWIYSAPTGRVTAFSEPVEWNLRWPWAGQPADPAHAPGYVVLGRDVLVTRTVTVDGAVVHRDELYSHYAPVWGGPAR